MAKQPNSEVSSRRVAQADSRVARLAMPTRASFPVMDMGLDVVWWVQSARGALLARATGPSLHSARRMGIFRSCLLSEDRVAQAAAGPPTAQAAVVVAVPFYLLQTRASISPGERFLPEVDQTARFSVHQAGEVAAPSG